MRSTSCASPARWSLSNPVCSGNGYCKGDACVCKPGYQGANCEEKCLQVNPCWTCPSGFIHWYDTVDQKAPGDDRCGCVPITRAPTVNLTSRPSSSPPTQNESGEDFAREASSSGKLSFAIAIVTAIVVTLMM
ncbi:hypothetical protein AKO1_003743 [Acrasis kona]|uniref:EGF-like domain-containing protein n=1 Tax=Acrasis kona TaxID=1008807 RepID=A0AAW2Z6I9_9EUKA